ncbi:MAG: HD domain-containing protein [Chloroherpetonaceae bacterium]|nr:HD domain-containing protein [Chloroherpetonaceae bacterium]MDW8438378.1 HD domain-containing protein [Chloroherpetonaceae bacterium]
MPFPEFLFRADGGFIRIPVWGHIPLDDALRKILSHPTFLRLKGIKQLSFAHYVFPGATHTRFEHSIGVYHLTKLILQRLLTNPLTTSLQTKSFAFDEKSCRLILASSLLHDIGHYPHAHLVENIPITSRNDVVFKDHQDLTSERVFERRDGFGSLAEILERDWKLDPDEVATMVTGKKKLAFSKLISGTLDPDKMDYLMRDAHHCSVPYGNIDIERLIESFVPDAKRKRFAITSKGIAPFESLMFAKYAMMRNVYWHHTVRALSAMLKRFIQDALDEEQLSPENAQRIFYHNGDERALDDLLDALPKPLFASAELLLAILERRPYKRAITLPATPDEQWQFRLATDAKRRKEKELALCQLLNKKFKLSLKGYEVVIDAPSTKSIFDYEDFSELQLYREKRNEFVPFGESGESAFTKQFILEFERATKKCRVVARADLAQRLSGLQSQVIEILES